MIQPTAIFTVLVTIPGDEPNVFVVTDEEAAQEAAHQIQPIKHVWTDAYGATVYSDGYGAEVRIQRHEIA